MVFHEMPDKLDAPALCFLEEHRAMRLSTASLGRVTWVALLVSACGCLYQVQTRIRETGPIVDTAQLGRVEPGKTTREQLIKMFGTPTSVQNEPDGAEVLQYLTTRRTTTDKTLLGVFSSHKESTGATTVFFDVRDGIVQRAWQREM